MSGAPGVAAPGLGPEWRRGPDGLLFRRGARVIVLDTADRLLLLRGHDLDLPRRTWWFTVGGGIGEGEDPAAAACREAGEEAGLRLEPADLVGPVFSRSAIFDFFARTCRQDEVFFLARVPAGTEVTDAGWTAVEREVIEDLRWWDLGELAATSETVYPRGLAALVAALVGGWDGSTRHLPFEGPAHLAPDAPPGDGGVFSGT